jgi:hypothetical protein
MMSKTENATCLAGLGGVNIHMKPTSEQGKNTMNVIQHEPVKLSEAELAAILTTMSSTANQERRFVQTLARRPLSTTKQCCMGIGCVNLSDLRQRTAGTLRLFDLEARCIHPGEPIRNGFGEDSGQQLWALYTIQKEVANEH